MTLHQVAIIQRHIIEHLSSAGGGYCEVPSASRPGIVHRVYFNEHLYSVRCTCEAGSRGYDCGHRLAVDRYFDEERAFKAKMPKKLSREQYAMEFGIYA